MMMISQSSRMSRLLAAVAVLVLGAAQAHANPVAFAPNLVIGPNVYGQGSDPTDPVFIPAVDYQLATNGEFYGASSNGLQPVQYSLNICLLPAGGTLCTPGINVGDPYSMIVELDLVSVATPIPSGGMYLLLSGVSPTVAYDYDAVRVYADSAPPVPGFTFSPVTRLARVSSTGVTNYYLGFFFADVNDGPITMRIEVDSMLAGGSAVLMTTAAYVPEPSTALLLGVGCVGLAIYRRR